MNDGVKSGKTVGLDHRPEDRTLPNTILESKKVPEEWRSVVKCLIFRDKCDVQSCSNYGDVKLMTHIMKIWEGVIEARLRREVMISEQQYGSMLRKM